MDSFHPRARANGRFPRNVVFSVLERGVAAAYAAGLHPVQEAAMEGAAVDVRFDSTHLFLDMSDGRAVSFPLDWFPVLQAATAAEREHLAISMDHQQLVWPEIDEDVNVPALLSFQSENAARSCDSPEGDFPASPPST